MTKQTTGAETLGSVSDDDIINKARETKVSNGSARKLNRLMKNAGYPTKIIVLENRKGSEILSDFTKTRAQILEVSEMILKVSPQRVSGKKRHIAKVRDVTLMTDSQILEFAEIACPSNNRARTLNQMMKKAGYKTSISALDGQKGSEILSQFAQNADQRLEIATMLVKVIPYKGWGGSRIKQRDDDGRGGDQGGKGRLLQRFNFGPRRVGVPHPWKARIKKSGEKAQIETWYLDEIEDDAILFITEDGTTIDIVRKVPLAPNPRQETQSE